MTQAELSANFDLSHEQQIYERWEASGCFEPDYRREQAFSIVLPPPNVTGSLHMGHGFNNTIMDALTRYHRMKGFNVLWQPGTDHAGIATQTVVERQLGLEGVTRHDLGREAFLDKVWEWKETSGGRITSQIRRLGSSVDWSRERFTLDEGLSKTVTEVFVRRLKSCDAQKLKHSDQNPSNLAKLCGRCVCELKKNRRLSAGSRSRVSHSIGESRSGSVTRVRTP